MFGDIYDKVVPKPSKAYGTRWIAHKSESNGNCLE